MINIDDNVKELYYSDNSIKSVKVEVEGMPEPEIVLEESMVLKESILQNDSLEFVGCISSYFSVQIYFDAKYKYKGKRVKAYIEVDDTGYIPLFDGIINNAKKTGDNDIIKIEAYDYLYDLGNVDVTDWYNNHRPTTLNGLLYELADYVGLQLSDVYMPNGNIACYFSSSKEVSQLSALHLLKHICQINGGYGRINRDGLFEIMYLNENLVPKKYPSAKLLPLHNNDLYPNMPGQVRPVMKVDENLPFYMDLEYDEYNVQPIQRVVIRDNEEAMPVSYGTGKNKYIIQGNLFAYNQPSAVLMEMAKNIYLQTEGISFTPFEADNYGLPWIECGDNIWYVDAQESSNVRKKFIVFSRNLKGIQILNDSYSAYGDYMQNEFITDLGSRIESLKDSQNKDRMATNDGLNELKKRVARLEAIVNSFTDAIASRNYKEKPIAEALFDGNFTSVQDDILIKEGEDNE